MRRETNRIWVFVLLGGVLACGDLVDAPVGPLDVQPIAELEIVSPHDTLSVGSTLGLTVTAYDSHGDPFTPNQVIWWAGDTTTASVQSGLVYGRRAGSAWIHVGVGEVQDSVQLRVLFEGLDVGENGLRVPGIVDDMRFEGFSYWYRFPPTENACCFERQIDGQALMITRATSMTNDTAGSSPLIMRFNGRPSSGIQTFGSFELTGSASGFGFTGDEGLIIWAPHPNGWPYQYMFIAVGETELEIFSSDEELYPEGGSLNAAGLNAGMLEGTLSFDAAAFEIRNGFEIVGQVTDTLIQAFVQLNTEHRMWVRSETRLRYTDGPFERPTFRIPSVFARPDTLGRGVMLEMRETLRLSPYEDLRSVVANIWIPNISDGTHELAVIDAEVNDTTGRELTQPWIRIRHFETKPFTVDSSGGPVFPPPGPPAVLADLVSVGGTLELVSAPAWTDNHFGIIQATFNAELEFLQGEPWVGELVNLLLEVVGGVIPVNAFGHPSVPGGGLF